MWEDERNKKGGRWLINLDKRQRHSDLDKFWLETVSFHSCHNMTIRHRNLVVLHAFISYMYINTGVAIRVQYVQSVCSCYAWSEKGLTMPVKKSVVL